MRAVFILKLVKDLLTEFEECQKKSFIQTTSITRKDSLLKPYSVVVSDGGKWVQEYFSIYQRERPSH